MDRARGSINGGVTEGLHDTADTARELAHTLERGADALDTASRTADTVSRKVERVTSAAGRATHTVASSAEQHPLTAVAVAFTIGFVAGRIRG